MYKIEVHNARRVSNALGFDVKHYDDLLINPKCKSFIKKYKRYLESTDRKDFLEFFNKTGIMLMHIWMSSTFSSISFDILGSSWSRENNPKKFNHHLCIVTKVDNLEKKNNKVYADGIEIYDLENDKDGLEKIKKFEEMNDRFKEEKLDSYSEYLRVNRQSYILYNYYDKTYDIDSQNTKQIILSPFGDVFVLKNDGTLLCNNIKYDETVEWIWEQNDYTKIIIFENKRIEYISTTFGNPLDIEFDHICYGNNFLALLKDKKLQIIVKEENSNKSVQVTLNGIDRIDYDSLKDELILYVGNSEIRYDFFGTYIETYDS